MQEVLGWLPGRCSMVAKVLVFLIVLCSCFCLGGFQDVAKWLLRCSEWF